MLVDPVPVLLHAFLCCLLPFTVVTAISNLACMGRVSTPGNFDYSFLIFLSAPVTLLCPFTFFNASVERVLPPHGPLRGGTLVTLKGVGLEPGTHYLCRFGGQVVPSTLDNQGKLLCTSPTFASQVPMWHNSTVEISLNGQQFTHPTAFIVYEDPLLTAASPSSGPVLGGTNVSLVGDGFVQFSGQSCYFGNRSHFQ